MYFAGTCIFATNNKIQVSVKGSIVAIIFTTHENVYVKAVATV